MFGKVALSVDPQGITLGGLPFRYTRTTLTVPWQNITAVVLFERRFGRTRVTYVGLTGRPPLQDPGVGGQTRKKRDAMVIRHGDADVVTTIRPAYCWEPDRDRLAAAVSANAPHVSLQVVE